MKKTLNDFEEQALFVTHAVRRILCQIDLDALSPTFGCAHLAYWRDKTSCFADMRRQEIMLTLALLYTHDYPGSVWRKNAELKKAIEALITFWCGNQYDDGAMDEWYKGERGFAACAFSTYAVARTLGIMGADIDEDIRNLATDRLGITSQWLAGRSDLFKTNHQAVAVAALAWSGHVLKNRAFTDNARVKLESILGVQTEEGWFPEVGRMDIGYTFLTLEFILMAMDLWNDRRHIGQFEKAFNFAYDFIGRDLTIADDYGVCRNPYLSRIAVILLSDFSDRAAHLRSRLENGSSGFKGYSSTLADDLRLLRYSYQPLLAYDYAAARPLAKRDFTEEPVYPDNDGNITVYEKASIAKFFIRGSKGLFAPGAGGFIRFFARAGANDISDYGYIVKLNSASATNYFYSRSKISHESEDVVSAVCPISGIKSNIPPFWARVILHAASFTSFGSRTARKCIDFLREKKGTAINQSSANFNSSRSIGTLRRRLLFEGDCVKVTDRLVFRKPVNKENILFLESSVGNATKCRPVCSGVTGLAGMLNCLNITKTYVPGNGWALKKISADIYPDKK